MPLNFCIICFLRNRRYQWSEKVVRRIFRSDWMVRNGAVNKILNVVVTPAVVVSDDVCYINNFGAKVLINSERSSKTFQL